MAGKFELITKIKSEHYNYPYWALKITEPSGKSIIVFPTWKEWIEIIQKTLLHEKENDVRRKRISSHYQKYSKELINAINEVNKINVI